MLCVYVEVCQDLTDVDMCVLNCLFLPVQVFSCFNVIYMKFCDYKDPKTIHSQDLNIRSLCSFSCISFKFSPENLVLNQTTF